jgi:hypothetical protein
MFIQTFRNRIARLLCAACENKCRNKMKKKLDHFGLPGGFEIGQHCVFQVKRPTSTAAKAFGRWIRRLAGYRAFHPEPLPPPLISTPQFVRALSDDDQLLGRLSGEGRRLPIRSSPYAKLRLNSMWPQHGDCRPAEPNPAENH